MAWAKNRLLKSALGSADGKTAMQLRLLNFCVKEVLREIHDGTWVLTKIWKSYANVSINKG